MQLAESPKPKRARVSEDRELVRFIESVLHRAAEEIPTSLTTELKTEKAAGRVAEDLDAQVARLLQIEKALVDRFDLDHAPTILRLIERNMLADQVATWQLPPDDSG